jgi:hypothetical protein
MESRSEKCDATPCAVAVCDVQPLLALEGRANRMREHLQVDIHE